MISKHIEMQSVSKSSVLRLVEYITSTQDKEHRIGEVFCANCRYDDPELVAREMLLTQMQNTRVRSDKTYHLLLSFRPGEDPDSGTIHQAVAGVCRELGFAEHQHLAAVHYDTDNVHVHVAINKVHPTRFTVRNPYMDHLIMAKACEQLEERLHLERDNHAPSGKNKTERKAKDIETMTGQGSFLSWLRKECLPELRTATTWDELHRTLAKYGVAIKLQNNGVVITAASGESVKGSGLDRSFSKSNLENRLGSFEPCSVECVSIVPEKHYTRDPIGPPTDMKKQFKEELDASREERKEHLAVINAERNRAQAALRTAVQRDRAKAKRIPAGHDAKRALDQAISDKFINEMECIRQQAERERQKVYAELPHHSWLSWLRDKARHGDGNALEYLRTRKFPGQPGNKTEVAPEKSIAFNDEYEHAREAHFANKQTAKDKVYQGQQKKVATLLAEIRLDRSRARRFAASGPLKHRLYEGIKKKYRSRLAAIRAETEAERQRIDKTWPRLDWTAWVRQQAEAGREEAIKIMRSRAYALAKKGGNAITSQTEAMTKIADAIGIDNVTANGTIIYRIGTEALRDDRESIRITRAASLDTAIMALRIAKQRFGKDLTIHGDEDFRDGMVKAAIEGKVFVQFDDPSLEKKRKQLLYEQDSCARQWRGQREDEKGIEL